MLDLEPQLRERFISLGKAMLPLSTLDTLPPRKAYEELSRVLELLDHECAELTILRDKVLSVAQELEKMS